MRQEHVSVGVVVLAVLVLAAACAKEAPKAEGPGGAVQTFYGHLNDGALEKAKALYTNEALAIVEDPAATEDVFGGWAEQETRRRSISSVEILDSQIAEGTATVEFEIRFADGSSVQRQVSLVEQNGGWKLGLIG